MQKKDKAWVYIGIPFRPSRLTYETFSYEDLPRVDTREFDIYKDFLSFGLGEEDYWHMEAQLCSPTGCYFKGNTYHDPHDRVMWRATQDGAVETSNGARVAESVSEFLARVKMENDIWRNAMKIDDAIEAHVSMRNIYSSVRVSDPGRLLGQLGGVLTREQMEYIAPYYRKYMT